MELHPLKSRKAKKVSEEIALHTDRVGSSLVEDIRKRGQTGPYRYEIGKKPRGIAAADYMNSLQQSVVKALARVGLSDAVEYDPEATRLASTEIVHYPDGNWTNDVKEDDLEIVFKSALTV